MDALKNWMHRKNHRSWTILHHEWYKIIYSKFSLTPNYSSLEYRNWNPWKDWCESWEEFQSSKEKPPKSEKPKAAMFSELFNLAKMTSDKLEEAKTLRIDLSQKIHENESLKNQNVIMEKKCADLQVELNIKEKMRVQNQEREVNLRTALEDRERLLTLEVQRLEEELCQERAKCGQLEKTLSSFQSQLVEYNGKQKCQYIKNDFHCYPSDKGNQLVPYKQLENGNGEKSLDVESIKTIVERLGPVTRLNVFDWLCSCEAEYRIWEWSGKDFEKILHRCTDSAVFSSIPPIIKMTEYSWHDMCKNIAERFVPDLDDVLCTEQMRKNEMVLQYFNRMWMIYRLNSFSSSRDEPEYINAILDGLLPPLREAIKYLHDDDYYTIEEAARLSEYSQWDSERQEADRYWEIRRAGPGCPSRVTIWRRLKENGVPHSEIDGATYWDLVVRLSRCEDLETRVKIN
ncbi:uncharacterized protein ACNLHF_014803 isoform 2-T3 [Anomaloglossus baeobatrachus]|uniref:uncharacterized protein LOC142302719 n=1 Tax=Anomaloglossus baeobatrachus TaxID=238106 RepID=UPI003F5067F6